MNAFKSKVAIKKEDISKALAELRKKYNAYSIEVLRKEFCSDVFDILKDCGAEDYIYKFTDQGICSI